MSIFSRWLRRESPRDRFANLLMRRVRESGDTSAVEYDPEEFELRREDGGRMFLGNLFAQYERTPKSGRESLLRSFLATWHTASLRAPEDFDDASPDLLPALRSRMYLVAAEEMCLASGEEPDFPHEVIAEHLAATLVYDLPHSMMTVGSDVLEKWGVTFYEAMEVAKRNLAESTTEYAQLGSVYALAVGDAYDASRLLLTDLLEQMEVEGDCIAAVPNRERLYVVGSEDEDGLVMLSKVVSEDLKHARSISGRLVRFTDGAWEPWLPPDDHPAHDDWRLLAVQSSGQDYEQQKDLIDKRLAREERDVFVASFSAMRHEETGRVTSFCSWADGIESWLPQTDEVFLGRNEGGDHRVLARVPWDVLREAAGDRMEPLGLYPERWRVNALPEEPVLERLAEEHPPE